ncbi:hypothetical protein D3C84_1007420 [compost metagenome]
MWIEAGVPITAEVSGPAELATTAQGNRHGETAGCDHLPKRRGRQHFFQGRQQTLQPGQGEASEHVGLFADLLAPGLLLGFCIGKQIESLRIHGFMTHRER